MSGLSSSTIDLPAIFDAGSPFLSSSVVGNWPDRLRLRHRAIIDQNSDCFRGARVLDLACHDGRWTYAAIAAGARHVTGIDVRPKHLENAQGILNAFGIPDAKYKFELGDMFAREDLFERPYDVVLCLGVLYHTARHSQLFDLIRRTEAETIIVDTGINLSPAPVIQLIREPADHPGNGSMALDAWDGYALGAYPSRSSVKLLLEHFGYEMREFDWNSALELEDSARARGPQLSAQSPVSDYASGARMTLRATKRSA